MKILLDCFGGDNAPDEVIKGARAACDEFGSQIILVGDKSAVAEASQRLSVSLKGMDVAHASGIFDMDEDPRDIVKGKPNSSMAVGLNMLAAGEGDAFISAGSTGGLVMGASLLVGRIEGAKRPALAVAIPHPQGCYLLLDAGANLECRPEHLRQFAVMGSAYQEKVFSVRNPRVCLVNVGKEENKGTPIVREAFEMLKEIKNINFCGNVEARELPVGGCDVAVADGFTGNMILKLSEGLAGMLFKEVKKIFLATSRTKIAAALVTKQFRDMAGRFDYSEYGGTPLLGIAKPVIKAHGSSRADAFKNAIKKAELYAGTGVIEDIASKII
ncbi:MAG TPA: phosphate acyltransferase PlsX [Oscillospiraceae bacterium]|nr:phosphate acyltransferase PlsX [Oscillospiraceae bacterium]HPS35302.1 phosphate acyltransferase PlsX [Oscillospiraceae bacterium]